jgi:threonine/homoserine efflux transporter RhtA
VSLLPATATLIGVVVLAQIPTLAELGGVALVIAGVALHKAPERRYAEQRTVADPHSAPKASVPAGSV